MTIIRVAAVRLGLALLLALVAGCLKTEGNLDRDGGGNLKLEISKLDKKGDESVRSQLVSPGVKLVNADFADSVGKYEVSFSDIEKLRTTPLFRNLRIVHKDVDKERRTLSVAIPRRPRAETDKNLPEDNYVVIDVTLNLPGKVVETSGERDGDSKVRWQIRVEDMLGTGPVELSVVYDVPAAAEPAAANP